MKDDRILLERLVEYCDSIENDVERFGNDIDGFIED